MARRLEFHSSFFTRIEVNAMTFCWEWTGANNGNGYGKYGTKYAHRVSYGYFKGPILDGYEVDHTCFTRNCVNPAHLRLATHRENCSNRSERARINARSGYSGITHCKRGHEFNEQNTYYRTDGGRNCRQCGAENRQKYTAQGVGKTCDS